MKPDIDNYRLFLVDMDDTLYEERDYVLSGFRAVAENLAERGYDRERIWQVLIQRFQEHGRERIFDHLASVLGVQEVEGFVSECVQIYREHTPRIALYPKVDETLCALRSLGRVIILTDGLPAMQRLKFNALGLGVLCDELICCWEKGAPKPAPGSLSGVVTQGQSDALFIGDDPARDHPLATALGIPFIRVRTGRFAENEGSVPPLLEINSFACLGLTIHRVRT